MIVHCLNKHMNNTLMPSISLFAVTCVSKADHDNTTHSFDTASTVAKIFFNNDIDNADNDDGTNDACTRTAEKMTVNLTLLLLVTMVIQLLF